MDGVFDKLKKAYLRSCLTSWWSKVDSDVLFPNLAEWKPESVRDKHGQPLAELKLCGIWLDIRIMSLMFLCLQGQSQV